MIKHRPKFGHDAHLRAEIALLGRGWSGGDLGAAKWAWKGAGLVHEQEVMYAFPAEDMLAWESEGGDDIRRVGLREGGGVVKGVEAVAYRAFSAWIGHLYFDIDSWKGAEEVEPFR